MWRYRSVLAVVALVSVAPSGRAGLYYSGEQVAELPSQWRGFLLDQRLLRSIAIKPANGVPPGPSRERYLQEADKLEKLARARPLSADESADLGALHVRLGDLARAVEVLRPAQRQHPNHFHIAANLGTAWQLQGDYDQAIACLQQAVRLAPGKLQKAEEHQLKLARQRQRRAPNSMELDDLFGVRYVNDDGKFEPGKLGAAERKKLPSDAAAIAQQLALWLPADGLLLWQLAELASAHGDIRTAAAIFEGCVSEFGMNQPELRRRRQLSRAAADELARSSPLAGDDAKVMHEGHAGALPTRSKRPLLSRIDQTALPAVAATGLNALPWSVLSDTAVDRKFQPTFAKYLQELDGKQVTLSGYMQPLGENLEVSAFMIIEYPVGCWFCEMPELTSILLVELPSGKSTNYTRSRIKVEGTLKLNANDPENFLYTVGKAKVVEVE